MGQKITIYYTEIELPEQPPIEEIENWGTDDVSEQYWRRKELPDFFEEVEYDKEGNVLLNSQQIDRKSTRLNSSHVSESRMPSSA